MLKRIWHVTIAAACIAGAPMAAMAQSGGMIKIGVLHSLSGTMAISETTLKDTILMMVDDLNKKSGLLGKKVEAVVVDPASNWPLFAEKARDLLSKEKVAAVFGCWTSVSRKSVLPVFEELNGLLFYPVQYEGEESSRNVFYTGAAPNQQAIPAVEYLMDNEGGAAKRWVLEAPITSIHEPPIRYSRPFSSRRVSRRRTSRSITRRSGTPTGRPRLPRSRASPLPARRRPWSLR